MNDEVTWTVDPILCYSEESHECRVLVEKMACGDKFLRCSGGGERVFAGRVQHQRRTALRGARLHSHGSRSKYGYAFAAWWDDLGNLRFWHEDETSLVST